MPNVFEFAAFDFAGSQRQVGVLAFQRLHPRHFVGTHDRFALFSKHGRLLVQAVYLRDLFVEALIGFRGQPIANQVGLDAFFSNRRAAWRGEIFATIPRFTISSATSRPVHWLMGRPDCSGFSQASFSIWHSWSAVIRAGVPGRGRSSKRSAMLKSFSETGCKSNQRCRHKRTASNETASCLAISALFMP